MKLRRTARSISMKGFGSMFRFRPPFSKAFAVPDVRAASGVTVRAIRHIFLAALNLHRSAATLYREPQSWRIDSFSAGRMSDGESVGAIEASGSIRQNPRRLMLSC